MVRGKWTTRDYLVLLPHPMPHHHRYSPPLGSPHLVHKLEVHTTEGVRGGGLMMIHILVAVGRGRNIGEEGRWMHIFKNESFARDLVFHDCLDVFRVARWSRCF